MQCDGRKYLTYNINKKEFWSKLKKFIDLYKEKN